MAFSEETRILAFNRAGGQCECTRLFCKSAHHFAGYRCQKELIPGGWEAYHIHADSLGGADTLANCEALCIPCHRSTPSYGRS
ncbi:MAG: HNH endonuclease [Janthinobacterium lividum]